MSAYHKTLARQIQKHLSNPPNTPQFSRFLQTVSDTYVHFDEDRALIERSLEISSQELGHSASLLKAALEGTVDGLLVVDTQGKIVTSNSRFAQMWQIPPDVLATKDYAKAIQFVLSQLTDPSGFTQKIQELYSQPQAKSHDTLEFKDGRVFDRYSFPQRLGDQIIGRVWSFRDVTSANKAQQKLQDQLHELERLNQLMVNRELKMIELKQEIAHLKSLDKTPTPDI